MIRIKKNFKSHYKHKNIIKLAKGFLGSNKKLFKVANQKVMKSLYFSFSDRKKKLSINKKLWLNRINSFIKLYISKCYKYNKLINKFKLNRILLNKKVMSEVSINNPQILVRFINVLL